MAKDDELVVPGAPASWSPPEKPTTKFAQLVVRIHQSSKLVRYFTYIVPVAVILLIPLLLGALVFPDASVGGVEMLWFCVWLMIAWLSLWGGRVRCPCSIADRNSIDADLPLDYCRLHSPSSQRNCQRLHHEQ